MKQLPSGPVDSSDSVPPCAVATQRTIDRPRPDELLPGQVYPLRNAPAADNTIRGGLILFKIPASALGNRPLELEIESPSGGQNAIIDIDV